MIGWKHHRTFKSIHIPNTCQELDTKLKSSDVVLVSLSFYCSDDMYMFKVTNKDTRTTSLTSFWYLYYQIWIDFLHCSDVPIVDIEQVNIGWVLSGICLAEIFFW